jgi:DNA-binding transcriptional ArsR family regulator
MLSAAGRLFLPGSEPSQATLLFSVDLIKRWLICIAMQVLTALSDPTRQRIVEMLSARELSAGQIAAKFDMSAPAISQHLKVLKDAKLVRVRADAQRRIYTLDREGFEEMDEWLARIRRFWTGKLDLLEQALKDDDRKSPRGKAGRKQS